MRGISEAIAMLLLIVITVAIMGTVAYFVFGTSKQFMLVVTDSRCTPGNPGNITLVLQAQGTTAGRPVTDFNVYSQGVAATFYSGTGCNVIDNVGGTNCNTQLTSANSVNPGEYIGAVISARFDAGRSYEVRIISGGRSQSLYVQC